jgi:hypothetical protein
MCPASFYGPGANSACLSCTPGTFAGSNGSPKCSLCSEGTYSPAMASLCLPCSVPQGSGCGQGSNSSRGLPCAAGRYGAGGLAACTLCDAGRYSDTTNRSSCANCTAAAGFGCVAGSVTAAGRQCVVLCCAVLCCVVLCCVVLCQGGATSSVGLACPAGRYSSGGPAVLCLPCDAGYRCDAGSNSSRQFMCAGGRWSPGNASECSPCSAGYACGNGSTEAAPPAAACAPGTYCNSGDAACSPCPPGRYSNAVALGLVCPSVCSNGSFCIAGATMPTLCDAGVQARARLLATRHCLLLMALLNACRWPLQGGMARQLG